MNYVHNQLFWSERFYNKSIYVKWMIYVLLGENSPRHCYTIAIIVHRRTLWWSQMKITRIVYNYDYRETIFNQTKWRKIQGKRRTTHISLYRHFLGSWLENNIIYTWVHPQLSTFKYWLIKMQTKVLAPGIGNWIWQRFPSLLSKNRTSETLLNPRNHTWMKI